MKVVVTTGFVDKTANNKFRPIGTVLEVDAKRADELIKANVAEKEKEPAAPDDKK
ncbi:MAG: hypothetical protein LBO74_08510 [Candidatus Symbiothrix sp.]|jgi:hypothetical protein|nr:hypothetical protein [Candidatus Symbiothrix sp.]